MLKSSSGFSGYSQTPLTELELSSVILKTSFFIPENERALKHSYYNVNKSDDVFHFSGNIIERNNR